VADTSREPIKTRNYYDIELAAPRILHEPIEFRAGILAPAYSFIAILLDDFETPMLGILPTRVPAFLWFARGPLC